MPLAASYAFHAIVMYHPLPNYNVTENVLCASYNLPVVVPMIFLGFIFSTLLV